MHLPLPITRELLLVGGGHTHALVMKMWGMNPLPGVRLTVINPHACAPYSGMLPGFVSGHYSRAELDIDLVQLARFARARMIAGRAVRIDTESRQVVLEDGQVLPFHIASIDVGVTSAMPEIPGFSDFATPAKPLDQFARTWDAFREDAAQGDGPARAAVIGGGVAGLELVLAMAHALRSKATMPPKLTLIERDNILPGLPKKRADFFRALLLRENITLLENNPVAALQSGRIILANGDQINSDFTVGAAGARPHAWLADSGLDLENGFISVGATLLSTNTQSVFAVGDCADLIDSPVPKAGVYAVRQAPILLANLRAALSGGTLKHYRPQKDYLKLVSLGRKSALAAKWGRVFTGRHVWRLKDRIDVKFMDQFRDLKPMQRPLLPEIIADGVTQVLGGKPICGGCGAKIGGVALAGVLADMAQISHPDVIAGPGDDAAILKGAGGGFQVLSTDQLRGFTHDTSLMAQIAAVHALGDIWAMAAQAQSALANIILPPLSPDLQQAWLGDIMASANRVFVDAGAAVIGGHTSQGAELSIGFTVTGTSAAKPKTKSSALPGDALILTKPIGTGTILAGEMAMVAQGSDVLAAFASMARAQGDWADALSGANAMTDVTGFGLAGHLKEICDASGVGITLDLDAIAYLNGALDLAAAGVRSSIFADNCALVPELTPGDDSRVTLLLDPQTAGGLLASVPEDALEMTLNALRGAGNSPAVIGHCTDISGGIRFL